MTQKKSSPSDVYGINPKFHKFSNYSEKSNGKVTFTHLIDVLVHCSEELSIAHAINDPRGEWQELETLLDKAGSQILKKQVDKAYATIFRMGIIAGSLSRTPKEVVAFYKDLLNRDTYRKRGLRKINSDKAKVHQFTRLIAMGFWQADLNKVIKVGEMSEKVWTHIQNMNDAEWLKASMPKDSHDIKRWIREIAPPYASRPGPVKKHT